VARHGTVPVARHGTGDSDRVTDLMIAAGISQLQSMGWTLEDTKETLARVYLEMRRVRDL
jgi:hypothetical protein